MTQRWPNGRVVRDAGGLELIVERSVAASAAEVWEWMTQPAKLEEWIGTWSGEPVVGGQIQFTMTAEPGATPEPVTILVCDRVQHSLLVDVHFGDTPWRLGFTLLEAAGVTGVFFTQSFADASSAAEVGSIGPGWEYYLDRMVAARAGEPLPDWDDYYPGFVAYYERALSSPE